MRRGWVIAGWVVALGVAAGVRLYNALFGPMMWGYDAWGHVSYVIFLDLYGAVPWADQGWSYFHPPLHYALGWVLAQFGSGEVLARGLSVLGSAASLATAGLAASLVRGVCPERPGLPLIAFGAIAFLPVHYVVSPMPGNELTQTFLTASALCVFIGNDRRREPLWIGDVFVGVLLGLGLLTKFNGLVSLVVVLASLAARPWLAGEWRTAWPRTLARGALMTAIALAMASPYYARNLATFGTPFQLSRDFPLVADVERDQPPGERRLADYLRLSPRMFEEPNPLKPHLLGSIWGTVYLDTWADIFRESDVERALLVERRIHRSTRVIALLGLVPTGLALLGAWIVARDVVRGRRREVYVPVGLLAGASLGAFCIFAWQVPLWSALKASYLLGLSLPFALCLARAVEGLADRYGDGMSAVASVALAGVALCTSVFAVEGWMTPRRADAPATGALRFYFGEYEPARRVYARLIAGAGYKAPWLDNLAAVDLADGEPERARKLYARAVATGREDPYRNGRLAVATALAGDGGEARRELDAVLSHRDLPELRANRGALRAADGDLAGAESDLRGALEAAPEMVPAWLNLAAVLGARGRAADAADAAARAAAQACRGPRGYPYGVGTGEVLQWGIGRRWLLLWDGEPGGLRAALPSFYREACRRLADGGDPT